MGPRSGFPLFLSSKKFGGGTEAASFSVALCLFVCWEGRRKRWGGIWKFIRPFMMVVVVVMGGGRKVWLLDCFLHFLRLSRGQDRAEPSRVERGYSKDGRDKDRRPCEKFIRRTLWGWSVDENAEKSCTWIVNQTSTIDARSLWTFRRNYCETSLLSSLTWKMHALPMFMILFCQTLERKLWFR